MLNFSVKKAAKTTPLIWHYMLVNGHKMGKATQQHKNMEDRVVVFDAADVVQNGPKSIEEPAGKKPPEART